MNGKTVSLLAHALPLLSKLYSGSAQREEYFEKWIKLVGYADELDCSSKRWRRVDVTRMTRILISFPRVGKL